MHLNLTKQQSTVLDVCGGFCQRIHRAAIRAAGLPCVRHVQKNPGVVAPQRHVCFAAGAVDATLRVEVLGAQRQGVRVSHGAE